MQVDTTSPKLTADALPTISKPVTGSPKKKRKTEEKPKKSKKSKDTI